MSARAWLTLKGPPLLAGGAWGLGLARSLAEYGLWTTFYVSPWAVGGLALACGLLLALAAPQTDDGRAYLLPLMFPLLYVVGWVRSPLAGVVLLTGGALLALLSASNAGGDRRPAAVLVAVTFGLYLRTLLPSVGLADTFEFQVVVPRLGLAHPTGYPLYILLGKLFTLLPLGEVAWRVNLSSAVYGTAAVGLLYLLVLRLTGRWLPALVAAAGYAFSATFWSQAVVAEVYTLHNLLAVGILYLLLAERVRWGAVAFLLGLSFTNHLTTALLIPAILVRGLSGGERPAVTHLRPFLLGLTVYLFIPLRWPALNQGRLMTVGEFVAYVTGGQFHGALRLDGWLDPVRWEIVARLLREPFGAVGLGLAAAGLLRLAVARRWRTLALTGLTFAAFVFYGLDYYVPDISVFLLPAHLILAVWLGIGLTWPIPVPRAAALLVLAALLPMSRVWLNYPQVDRSHDRGRRAWGEYVLSLPLAEGGAILADVEKFAPLYYLQQVEGLRPDLDIVLLGDEGLYYADMQARLAAGQTVYLARYLPDLGGLYLRSQGPLVEVAAAPFDPACRPDALHLRFGEAVRLTVAQVKRDPFGRPLYHLTLYWQAEEPIGDDLAVRLRLVDEAGRVRWEDEGSRPVNGLYPTNAWPVGMPIADYHPLPIPSWLARGEYTLEVGLFPPFGEEGLPVRRVGAGDGGPSRWWWPLRGLTLEPPPPSSPLPQGRRVAFSDGAWLTGCDIPQESPAGTPLTVALDWRGVSSGTVRLSWSDAMGREVAEGAYPLPEGTLRGRYVLTAPQEVGIYTLRARLPGRSAHCGWLAPAAAGCDLSPVTVLPAQEGVANFGGRVVLLSAEVGRSQARPGETVPVLLRWRAARAMEEDYTVFVHLVGPDGRLHGQVDAWPVQGTYPTSGWEVGAEVNDPYEVRLDDDAPAGEYRVEVGLYLLATMQRLPVVGADGRPVGDAAVVGTVEVGGGF